MLKFDKPQIVFEVYQTYLRACAALTGLGTKSTELIEKRSQSYPKAFRIVNPDKITC